MVEEKHNRINNVQVNTPVETYAIGILKGNSPFNLSNYVKVENPIVSRNDFDEGTVNFVADPFALYEDGEWVLFFEVMGVSTRKGKIYVTTSKNLKKWTKAVLVLEESFHLSYPQVFEMHGEFYMLPESFEANEIRLYKALDFPLKWALEKILLPISSVDSTLYFKEEKWWLFTCDAPHKHDRLRLFYADDLQSDWIEHPQSPIRSKDSKSSRPAGKLFEFEGRLYRVAQNCSPFYGYSVNAFEVITMTTEVYVERIVEENPIIGPGQQKWNKVSSHHLDLHQKSENEWIGFVDGRRH
ncbi:MAG: hypothetical protein P1U56_08805 [Saprospiraceae bacterium]|nr:hypothetical protein [Saprospiraceae bacterium]